MSSSPSKLTAAHVACLNEVLRQAPLMIERWRGSLVEILNRRYTSTLQNIEKRHLQAALLALNKHQAAITKGFTTALNNTISSDSEASANTEAAKPRGFDVSTSFDNLELMGDHEVQDSVDRARVLQTVTLESEAGLAAVSARLSAAQGFSQVSIDKNPLRPEIFSQALLKTVQGIPVDNAIRSLWFSHGAVFMGQQVQALYLALNEMLMERGVAPAAYRVITKRKDKVSARPNDASQNGVDGPESAFPSSAFDYPDSEYSELPPIAFPPLEEKLPAKSGDAKEGKLTAADRLRRLFSPGDDASIHNQVSTFEPVPGLERQFFNTVQDEALTAAAQSADRSLALRLVSFMLEKMSTDPRLLAPVRQMIANVGPAFLRLASTAPHLFSEESHPARSLLDTIADRSLAFASESASGFAEFMQDLNEVAAQLTQETASNSQHFIRLVAAFEQKIAQRDAVASENLGRTVQARLLAEQCEALATKISAEILERPDFVLSNPVISGFLSGPWALVIAKERLAIDADKTGLHKAVFSLTLGELLWSLDFEQAAPHAKHLAKVSPSILERLYGGLLSVGYPLADAKAFFDEVSVIHQRVISAGEKPVPARVEQEKPPVSKPTKSGFAGLFATGDSAHGIKSWLAPSGSQQADLDSDELAQKPRFQKTRAFLDTGASKKPELEERTQSSGSIELQLGAWVELMENDQWLRAQLTWVSLYRTLFIFTSAGGRTHSMNEPLLQYYLLQGLVKVISQDYVSTANH